MQAVSNKRLPDRQGYTRWLIAPGLEEWTRANGQGKTRWVYYWFENGRRKERTLRVANKTQAKQEAARLTGLRASGDVIATPSKMTLADLYVLWAERWEQKVKDGERSARTWQLVSGRWEKYVGPVVGNVKVNDLTKTHVATVIARVKKAGKSTSLQDGLLDLLSGLCRFGIERELMTRNPARELPQDDRPVVRHLRETYVLTDAEVESLIASASSGWTLFFRVLQQEGLRLSECLGLTYENLDLTSEGAAIHVRHQLDRGTAVRLVPLKTKQSRRNIPLPDGLRRDLLAHKVASRHSGPTDLVFSSASGRSPGATNAARAFSQALKRSGIQPNSKRLSIHGLRHAYGTRLLRAGFPVEAVSRLMGHSNPTITANVYAHVLEAMHASGELASRYEAVWAAGGAS